MSQPLAVHRGDYVRITFADRTVTAFVALASANGKSLFVMFDALLGNYAGLMPLSWDDARGEYVPLGSGQGVTLSRVEAA